LLKSDILSKEEEARIAREKKNKLDEIKKKYSGRVRGTGSSRAGVECLEDRVLQTVEKGQITQVVRHETQLNVLVMKI